jgi:hypothetical protein
MAMCLFSPRRRMARILPWAYFSEPGVPRRLYDGAEPVALMMAQRGESRGSVFGVLSLGLLIFSSMAGLMSTASAAGTLDFSNRVFGEPIGTNYWSEHLQPGIRVRPSDYLSTEETTFEYRTLFLRARFISQADFSFVGFDSTIDLRFARFASETDFSYTRFSSIADFSEVHFASTSRFVWTSFESVSDFTLAKFDSLVILRADFDSLVSFNGTLFERPALFVSSQIHSSANFDFSSLRSAADFASCVLGSRISFRHTQFDSVAVFAAAKFGEFASFEEAVLRGNADFGEVSLPDSLVRRQTNLDLRC